jgi:hypothetical protein
MFPKQQVMDQTSPPTPLLKERGESNVIRAEIRI